MNIRLSLFNIGSKMRCKNELQNQQNRLSDSYKMNEKALRGDANTARWLY